ncbi:hypothetical protein LWI28_020300 [Acer negundo]|uniref:Reverse transcriptase zinc-binding domain-containing protein n=1 Tax=Acer negundo TaxID=4023 RepID=A0AAD5IRK5_ACENE|nr:hypothetical protein LWI28_020300 [Acer negundo]
MSNMFLHKISIEDRCPSCQVRGKSTFHALWECKKLRYVRDGWLPNRVDAKCVFFSFVDFILHLLPSLNVEEWCLFCTILWRVWFIRNVGLHGALRLEISDVKEWVQSFLAEFYLSNVGVAREVFPLRNCNIKCIGELTRVTKNQEDRKKIDLGGSTVAGTLSQKSKKPFRSTRGLSSCPTKTGHVPLGLVASRQREKKENKRKHSSSNRPPCDRASHQEREKKERGSSVSLVPLSSLRINHSARPLPSGDEAEKGVATSKADVSTRGTVSLDPSIGSATVVSIGLSKTVPSTALPLNDQRVAAVRCIEPYRDFSLPAQHFYGICAPIHL